jgi:uncharacterized protein (TIGR02246 family)
MKLVTYGITALFMSLSLAAFAGPAEEANAVIDKWAASYSANDVEAIVKLYTPDAVFLGTTSPIIADTPETRRAYFARLPGTGNKSAIAERRTIVISDTAVVGTGFYNFIIMRDGKANENANRFTMLLVKRDNEWLIAHHHSSSRPKPVQ